MKSTLKGLLALCLGVCALTTPEQAEALLAGAKSTGMGQVGVAYAQDTFCVAYNPAGLVDVGNRIDVSVNPFYLRERYKVSGSAVPVFNNSGNAIINPWMADFDSGFATCIAPNLSFGVTTYNNAYVKVSYGDPLPLLGTSNLKLQFIQEMIAPTLSWRINDVHSIGISLDVAIQRLGVQGLQNFDNAFFTAFPGNLTNRGWDYSWGVGATLGWKGDFTDWFSLGVAYQPQIHMTRFSKYKGFLPDQGRLSVPSNVAIGMCLSPLPQWDICLDVKHIFYNDVRALHNPIVLSTGPTSPNRLGLKNGLGFGWRGQTIYRFGTAYQILDNLTIRAGYRHGKTPIPSTQTAANLLTTEIFEDLLTFGASWQPCFFDGELSFFFAHGFERTTNGKGSIPAGLGGGEVDLTQGLDAFGFQASYNF